MPRGKAKASEDKPVDAPEPLVHPDADQHDLSGVVKG